MSLKLGNTNIAGTQILYSTTGNNTDGAMTQNATTDKLNNCVHKTDSESIDGVKTFNHIQKLNGNTLKCFNFAKGTNPSSTQYANFYLTDNTETNGDNTALGRFRTKVDSDGLVTTSMTSFKNATGTTSSSIAIYYPSSGNAYTSAPASDFNGSIVTTVNKSKATNGYFKFGNGLIIQWGGISSSAYSQLTINFPTSFSNTNYKIILTQEYNNTGEYNANAYVRSKTNTSCNILGQTSYIAYIAVGY